MAERSNASGPSGKVAGSLFNGSMPAESDGFIVTTLAGSGTQGFRDGPADSAQFNNPSGIAVDAAGTVYIGDFSQRIRKIAPDGTISTLAGTGVRGFADGPASLAQFDNPVGVAVGSSGEVFVADAGNSRIRKVLPDGTVSTLAVLFAIAVDTAGVVYIADRLNNRVRTITPDGTVSTLAGTGEQGFADGTAGEARFNGPSNLAVDATGGVYVADAGNQRIRRVAPGTVETLPPSPLPTNPKK